MLYSPSCVARSYCIVLISRPSVSSVDLRKTDSRFLETKQDPRPKVEKNKSEKYQKVFIANQ
jgi:hypothetical protein